MQGTQKYVAAAFLVLGVVVWVSLNKLLGEILLIADLPNPALIGSDFTMSTLLGLAGGLFGGIFAFRHPVASAFAHDVVNELEKVTWPGKKEIRAATTVVIITTLLLAFVMGMFDTVWAKLTGFIYSA